jgi:hypothetical protein
MIVLFHLIRKGCRIISTNLFSTNKIVLQLVGRTSSHMFCTLALRILLIIPQSSGSVGVLGKIHSRVSFLCSNRSDGSGYLLPAYPASFYPLEWGYGRKPELISISISISTTYKSKNLAGKLDLKRPFICITRLIIICSPPPPINSL